MIFSLVTLIYTISISLWRLSLLWVVLLYIIFAILYLTKQYVVWLIKCQKWRRILLSYYINFRLNI